MSIIVTQSLTVTFGEVANLHSTVSNFKEVYSSIRYFVSLQISCHLTCLNSGSELNGLVSASRSQLDPS